MVMRNIFLAFAPHKAYIGTKTLSNIVDRSGVPAGLGAWGVCPPDGPTTGIIVNML
jgi:hypothetical protein